MVSTAATVASQTPVWPTMSGLAKLATMKSYLTRLDRATSASVDAFRAHLGGEVVRRDLGARNQLAVLARERRLAAAVEEVRHVGVLLGLGDVELAPAGVRDRVGQGSDLFERKCHDNRQPCLVLGHRHDEDVARPRPRSAPGRTP